MPEGGLRVDAALRLDRFRLHARFDVGASETLVLVGPSGSGKSTCLAIVAGLVRPDQGSVGFDQDVWCDAARGIHVTTELRRVGMLFQDFALFPHLSVAQNVRYGPLSRGRALAVATSSASAWIQRLGLAGFEGHAVRDISGGQRQRVALARALAAEPRLLLLDEPFGSLDVATRGAVRSELRTFLAECGLPAVLVTHDPVDALAFGDRIAVLEEGQISQIGSREELLSRPRSDFVAELAGLNLLRAELAAGKGLKEARVGSTLFHVLADDRSGAAFLSFSPAEVALSAERLPGSPQNVFPGRVRDVLPLTDRLRIVLDVGVVLVAEVTREAAAALALGPGRPVWASVKATVIRVYA